MITDTIPLFPQGLICCNLGLDNDRLINLIERDLHYDLEGSAYYITKESNLHEQEDYAWFTSSIQENSDSLYGKAKKNARLKFEEYSNSLGYKFYGIIAPNIFGPFCKPNYNSFIATFSSMLVNKENPSIDNDKEVSLIYVGDFIDEIIKILNDDNEITLKKSLIYNYNVSDVLTKLNKFNKLYCEYGQIPSIDSHFDLCLFNTFRSYININNFKIVCFFGEFSVLHFFYYFFKCINIFSNFF